MDKNKGTRTMEDKYTVLSANFAAVGPRKSYSLHSIHIKQSFKKLLTKAETRIFFGEEKNTIVLIEQTPSFGEENFMQTSPSWLSLAFLF
jgi:hypothetical protein